MKANFETLGIDTIKEHELQALASLGQMEVSTGDLEQVIHATARVCRGLESLAYSYTEHGILTGMANQTQHNTEHENALDFVESYYELTAGVISLIGAAAGVISTGLANADIEIAKRG